MLATVLEFLLRYQISYGTTKPNFLLVSCPVDVAWRKPLYRVFRLRMCTFTLWLLNSLVQYFQSQLPLDIPATQNTRSMLVRMFYWTTIIYFDVTSNVSFLRGSNTQLRDVTAGPLSDVTLLQCTADPTPEPRDRTSSRGPSHSFLVVTSIATIGTFEATRFFNPVIPASVYCTDLCFFPQCCPCCNIGPSIHLRPL